MFINMEQPTYIIVEDRETILWENSAPTSAFSAQNVTLSDSLSNYDELEFIYCASTSNTTPHSVKYKVTDFIAFRPTLGDGNQDWSRAPQYIDDTTIYLSGCSKIYGSSSDNSKVIHLKIIGIKKVTVAGDRQIKTGFLASIPSDGFVNCGFDPKHVIVVSKYNGNNTNAVVYDEDDSTTTYRQYYSNSTVQNESVAMGTADRAGFDSVGNGTNGFTLNHSYTSYFTNVRYIATD